MKPEVGAYDVLRALADVASAMTLVSRHLQKRTETIGVTSGCNIARYQDAMGVGGEIIDFEFYVEAQVSAEVFWWRATVLASENEWRIQRMVGKASRDGEADVCRFEDFATADLNEFIEKLPQFLEHFVLSATKVPIA